MTYASEFGGFDISTGTGELDGDWSDWDDETAYETPPQENNSHYTENVRNDGQEMNQNTTESETTDNRYYENDITENWNMQDSFESTGNDSNFYDRRHTEGYAANDSRGNRTENGTETINGTVDDAVISNQVTTVMPTDTPTPAATPTLEPTSTPTPAFTEVPEEELPTVTEYKEEYKLPPMECLRKMKLFYWIKDLPGGEYAEIQLHDKDLQNVLSVRLNGQEKEWEEKNTGGIRTLKIQELSKEKNHIELAVIVPEDLTWTRDKKNVILTYNVFEDKR